MQLYIKIMVRSVNPAQIYPKSLQSLKLDKLNGKEMERLCRCLQTKIENAVKLLDFDVSWRDFTAWREERRSLSIYDIRRLKKLAQCENFAERAELVAQIADLRQAASAMRDILSAVSWGEVERRYFTYIYQRDQEWNFDIQPVISDKRGRPLRNIPRMYRLEMTAIITSARKILYRLKRKIITGVLDLERAQNAVMRKCIPLGLRPTFKEYLDPILITRENALDDPPQPSHDGW